MLWLALEFPHLALDAMALDASETQLADVPFAIVENDAQRRFVADCNALAAAHGIRRYMPLGAAQALCGPLRHKPRSIEHELQLIERRATWAFRFSPVVSIRNQRIVLLEIDPSRRLFGGLRALLDRIRAELDASGFSYRAGAAMTPAAAVLLARANVARVVSGREKLQALIETLALEHGEFDETTLKALHGIGVTTFRGLFALPRAEVGRRFGQHTVDYGDRLLGRKGEPLTRFEPPDQFHAGMELPAPIHSTEALAFGAKRLMRELGEWLEARQLAVLRVQLELTHDDHAPSTIDIGLRRATSDTAHLVALLRTHLERIVLPAPAEALKLSALECTSIAAGNGELFERAQADDEDIERLIDRLRSRLGHDAVKQIALTEDHRPERAQKFVSDAALCRSGEIATGSSGASRKARRDIAGRGAVAAPVAVSPLLQKPPRPVFLVEPAKPLTDYPNLTLDTLALAGPERIESGWWDGHSVRRDYFRATSPDGARYWLYLDRSTNAWFVHGVFG